MNPAQRLWRSTVGRKIVMAVTGIIGIGFVLAHITGNLLVFKGPDALNTYSHFLHGPGAELLWVARVVLILAVILHVAAAYSLTQQSHAARPQDYTTRVPQVSTLASRVMRWGGVLLLVFIVFHILHFTTGTFSPGGPFIDGDVYHNVVQAFHVWWVALFYIVSMVFLGLHLYHGAWSSARTLSIAGDSPNPLHHRLSAIIAIVVWAGFTLVPLGIFLGWLG
ncbi:MAG: succinate dehydrogenase cytochrome b subunit [Gemmatimonadota bacterium]|nr:succinate dehydrogenase cytochrome b subunit [Gemmatimonadota bacterium]